MEIFSFRYKELRWIFYAPLLFELLWLVTFFPTGSSVSDLYLPWTMQKGNRRRDLQKKIRNEKKLGKYLADYSYSHRLIEDGHLLGRIAAACSLIVTLKLSHISTVSLRKSSITTYPISPVNSYTSPNIWQHIQPKVNQGQNQYDTLELPQ